MAWEVDGFVCEFFSAHSSLAIIDSKNYQYECKLPEELESALSSCFPPGLEPVCSQPELES